MGILRFAVSPGRILRNEFLEPLGLSAGGLAKALGVPRTRIERIVAEETAVSVDTALRLSTYFRTTPEFWLNLQTRWDLARADASTTKGIVPHPEIAA